MYTWCDINLKNFEYNFNVLRSKLNPSTKIMTVVKQDGYGHGMVEISKTSESLNVDFLGVHSKEEALKLLDNEITTPILILSNIIDENDVGKLISSKVRFSVRDESLLTILNLKAKQLGLKALVHIKVDTGMNRLGINEDIAEKFIISIDQKYENIEIEGIFSHFSSADSDAEYTRIQLEKFNKICKLVNDRGISIPCKHISNSSAVFTSLDAQLDMVRTGIMLYGICPVGEDFHNLKPVLSLRTKVIHIKGIESESFVSYSKTFKTSRNTLLAVIDAGYGHGYSWQLSNKSEVIIGGKKCNIVGRVCMDHILVDITDNPEIKMGDIVTLIGQDGQETITAQDLAKKSGTIPYEVLTRLQHLPKKYL